MSLHKISPIDGRYAEKTAELNQYFSEKALIHYRLKVELHYFLALCQIPLKELSSIKNKDIDALLLIDKNFSDKDAKKIKEIEKQTNHDVKAVEYFLREKFDLYNLGAYKEFIHFGLTSQDVNNTAMPMMLQDALKNILLPETKVLISELDSCAKTWKNIPMLARTHGQAASPTTLGKEFKVFVDRLNNAVSLLTQIPHSGKFGGATGNFNAHCITYPKTNWIEFANSFLSEKLNLKRQQITTQIDQYDGMASIFNALSVINTILIDFSRDIWTYVMLEYFKQKTKKGEVGSSAMPHKVNPIDFENAEGNLGLANALFSHLSQKLPISRLQRDLSDSTVTRNIGVPFAHTLIAIKSIRKGMGKLLVKQEKIAADINKNWAVLAEAIQSILRRENYPDPYNALKDLTRGKDEITRENLHSFIDTLKISKEVKTELKKLSPETYVGYAMN